MSIPAPRLPNSEVLSLGALFKGNGGNKSDEVPTGTPCVRYGDLYTRHEFFIATSKACISNERAGAYTSIRYGDVLFAASGETIEDIGRSAVNLIEGDVRCGGDVIVLRPEVPVVPRYLGYAGDSPASRHQKACMGRGFTVVHIYGGELKRLALPLPPLPEQAAIVRFLDHADRRIRRYIRAKQKLIKLLEEQKQAIIHRAVTRGLDPNVRLKPSGVEWLGDVPEHWDVRRVRNCLDDTRAGIWGDDPTPANEADHVTCLRVADFDMSRLSVHGSKLTQRAVPASARMPRLLTAGDILMEKSGGGEAEPVGRVVLYDEDVAPYAICSNFIVRLRPNRATMPQFLLHVLAIMQITRRNVPCIKQTTGIQNLDERAYLSLAIGVPPIAEQRAIVAALREKLLPIEQGAIRARHEIELLHEYRTRLIADVVTGKLDVREAASLLPDEVEEPELLDELEAEGDTDEAGAEDTDAVPEEAEA